MLLVAFSGLQAAWEANAHVRVIYLETSAYVRVSADKNTINKMSSWVGECMHEWVSHILKPNSVSCIRSNRDICWLRCHVSYLRAYVCWKLHSTPCAVWLAYFTRLKAVTLACFASWLNCSRVRLSDSITTRSPLIGPRNIAGRKHSDRAPIPSFTANCSSLV